MKNNPVVSVLMPVYNGSVYLREAVDSILAQTYIDFEFIIINDGSTDRTGKLLDTYKDSRIKIITHPKNMGIVHSLNEGITLSKGKYIARMDADDIAENDRLKNQVTFLDTHIHIDIVGSSITVFGLDNYLWKLPTNPAVVDVSMLFRCSLAHPSVMIRKKSLIALDLTYQSIYRDAEDYYLWIRALSKGLKIANIGKSLLRYRTHETQIGHENTTQAKSTRGIYKWQLKKRLHVNATNNELNLHHKIATLSRSNLIELDEKRNWLVKIISSNAKVHAYPDEIMRELCAEYWMDNCYVSTLGSTRFLYMLRYPSSFKTILDKAFSKYI